MIPAISRNCRRTSFTMDCAALLHRAHGERREHERQHGPHEHAHQHRRAGQREVQRLRRVLLHDVHVAHQQGQRRQGRGADGEPLARGGRGVAQGVQRVRPLPDVLRQAAISAMPPALSATGPYASVARVMPSVDSIPTPAMPMPYSPWLNAMVKAPASSTISMLPPEAK